MIKSIISIFKASFYSIFNKRSGWIIFSSLLRIIILIAINNLMTKELDFQNLSFYYLVISVYNFFGSIIVGPFGDYINKIFFKVNEEHSASFFLESFYKKLFLPIAATSFILLVIVLYFYFGLTNNYFIEIPILIALMLIFRGIFDSNISFINALGYYKWYSILITFNALFYFVFSYLFTSLLEPTYFTWTAGFIFSNIIFSLISTFVFRSKIINKPSKQKFYFNSKLLKFIPSLITTNLLLWLLTDGFRFISEFKFGLKSSGVLLLGFALSSQIFSIMSNFILPIFSPNLLKAYSESTRLIRYISIKNYFKKIIPFLVSTLFLAIIFSKLIINVLVDISKNSNNLIIIFIIGLVVEFVRSLINVIKSYKLSESKLSYQVYSLIIPIFLLIASYFFKFESIIVFALYVLLIYIVYLGTSIVFLFRLKGKID